MGMSGACILATVYTWRVTQKTERQTRYLRKMRIAAVKRGEVVMDDVDIHADLQSKPKVLEA
jgi:hypothetical protein